MYSVTFYMRCLSGAKDLEVFIELLHRFPLAGNHLFFVDESLQKGITAELQSRGCENMKKRKNGDEISFFVLSRCQSTFLMLSERLSALVEVPF